MNDSESWQRCLTSRRSWKAKFGSDWGRLGMSSDFDTVYKHLPLPQVLKFIVDNRGKTVPTADSGIPLIATNCIKDDELYPVFEKIRYVSNETHANWFRSHPIPGDIIFVNKGTPDEIPEFKFGERKEINILDLINRFYF